MTVWAKLFLCTHRLLLNGGDSLRRWEAGLADRLQYNDDGDIKTEVVKAPFIQVELPYLPCCAFQYVEQCFDKEDRVISFVYVESLP